MKGDEHMDAFSLHEQEQLKLSSISCLLSKKNGVFWYLLQILPNIKVVKCGRTCVVCDQPKTARTHAHRTHIYKVFSHAHAHVRPHTAHVRARTHLRKTLRKGSQIHRFCIKTLTTMPKVTITLTSFGARLQILV